MASEFTIRRKVEFSETDMAGIVHYSNFFRYMEAAEHAFFRSLGFSVAARPEMPRVGWPRVHASCDYLRPLRFEDDFEVRMVVAEKRSKSLTYEFTFHKMAGGGSEEVARGRVTVVCVAHTPEGQMKATSIPAAIADRIEATVRSESAAP